MTVPYRVVHRRNHAATAIVLVVAGLAIILSAFLPMISASGPSISTILGLTVTPQGSVSAQPIVVWYGTGGATILLGVLLLVTRVRGLGVLWRLVELIPLVVIGVYAGLFWRVVLHPEALAPDGLQATVVAVLSLGQLVVSPGLGLVIVSIAIVVALIGVMLPSYKTDRPGAVGTVAAPPPYDPRYGR